MYKNLHDLKLADPWSVNWDKASDITWLYGPKLSQREMDVQPQGMKLTVGNLKEVDASNKSAADIDDDSYSLVSSLSSSVSSISFNEESCELSDDSSEVSSIDSGYITDYCATRVAFPPKKKLYYEEELDYSTARPILKASSHKFSKQTKTKRTKTKKVSFNYIVNTREIINGMSVDYDFLDQDCL